MAYLRYVRPWQLTWGATAAEVARRLPSDDLVTDPTFDATRAITLDAPPEQVWPWLVQIGLTRAGWYSYDLLDNLGRPSARRIIPELQHLAAGRHRPDEPGRQAGDEGAVRRCPHLDGVGRARWHHLGLAARRNRHGRNPTRHPRPVALPVALTVHRVLPAGRVRRHLDDAQDAPEPARADRHGPAESDPPGFADRD